jgi:SAM-dependent methyltransferase
MHPGGAELLAWLASLPPASRDAALEERLGIDAPAPSSAAPGDHMVGYHASAVAPIVHALAGVPVVAGDVVVDLGAGLGKVVLLARLLTGATARGVELQPTLVERARAAAARLRLDVGFALADAREADLADGTVFFMYLPFTGPVLGEVLARLHAVASRRAIVVCSLGLDLVREAPWLAPRSIDAFWLMIYDSVVPGVAPRAPRLRSPGLGPDADAVALDRAGAGGYRASGGKPPCTD